MHARRLACMLLGFWLAGSILITFIAADSANSADRLLRNHGAAASERIKDMGQDEARLMLLAYPVRQQTRWWLEEWSNLELLIGGIFFFFMLFGTKEGKITLAFTLGIFAIVLFQRLYTLPQLLFLGSVMDFVPANVVMPERNQLIAVQNAFTAVDLFKDLVMLGMAAYFIARTPRSNHFGKQVDFVDKADYRHVDR